MNSFSLLTDSYSKPRNPKRIKMDAKRLSRFPALLFCHPSMEDLASAIAAKCSRESLSLTCFTPNPGSQSQTLDSVGVTDSSCQHPLSEENLTHVQMRLQPVEFQKNGILWDSFKDGWPNLFIDNVKQCAGRDVIFLGSFHSPEVVFEQLSLLYTMPRYLVRSFKFILPYFPTGTMERVDTEGQVATAKVLAMMLSSIPSTAHGPAQIVIFDIHALQERFYFSDTIIPRLESAIPLLHREMLKLPHDVKFNLAIAFPDEGAHKRFHGMFEDFPLITCIKVRNGDKRVVTIKEGEAKDQHIIIIDDLVQSGGTLRNCARALLEKGAASVSAFVTHAVFPQNSWRAFTTAEAAASSVKFEHFWITDSIPHARTIAEHAPFKLLSLCDVISETLLGYDLVQHI
ncbi:ribose-phosphate pyrophosphokinase 4-like isoform X2 [Acanthaster planci]|uniref:Ribose-phosphate pyrophosphokinase 4-like isoform X2 n=2 Tax=Acanthaster planci TaxID=133434 RepID=A0A8B7YAX8_ACAPL|nr:ribose-phosphate pyrophosphokinase 4-like isoform X2 [Acanthaster planci]